jgi:preprotein translocase subunit SecF
VQEDRRNKEFIIGTELADEAKLDQTRQGVQQVLREKYANTGDKLDLNNATQSALQDRLRGAALGLDDNQLKDLVGRILNYRDTQKNGILKSIDEVSAVPGADQKVLAALKQNCALGTYNLRSVDIVGPRAGAELRNRAVLATLCALGGMLVYIGFRFHWVSGAAAIIATIHDVAITLGLFVLTGRQIDLTIIAALLTLIGYSTNDTIVVFDRIRENLRNKRRGSFLQLVNDSVNQTLSRTILTSSTTFLACLSLFVLGGPVLNNIAFALLVGIVVGTYSSVFVAGALVVVWEEYREKRAAAARTGRPATVKG